MRGLVWGRDCQGNNKKIGEYELVRSRVTGYQISDYVLNG